ncbi:MAG: bifunctional diguanylate cyclase/phosphodiesterase [Candidatus Magnetoovum sp. WYHC-5]|nr:bifunctional diguanylate cyclase/phosphodiesterase [Candidatus Magnetoovum sp. WYHC-5]
MNVDTELLNAIIDNSKDAIVISDANNSILEVNVAFIKLTGYEKSEVKGITLFNVCYAESHTTTLFESTEQITKEDSTIQYKSTMRSKNGEAIWADSTTHIIYDEYKQPVLYLTIMRTLAKLDAQCNQGVRVNHYDPLTNLPNVFLLYDRLEQTIISARRTGNPVSLLTFGLDRFTVINEGLGFHVGDMVIKEVGARLEKTIRKSDTVARLAGDRFCLVMSITVANDSVVVAEKILNAMNEGFLVQDREINLTASIGISMFPTDSEDTNTLLLLSESAMRHVKQNGGNAYQFFSTEMNEKARRRIEIENNLRTAIQYNEFILYYQPKVNIETNAIVGAEALLRWNKPGGGIVPPNEFIPIAEESGLIALIGQWVIQRACEDIKKWQEHGVSPVRVSINVAGIQLRNKDIITQVKETIAKYKIAPNYIELEITESSLILDPQRAVDILNAFQEMGVHVSIDDFGTGYSSLSYLSRFPVNTLKIDREFIKDIQENKNNAEITRAIIGLSKSLKLEVVAEGAENVEHINFLKAQDCTTVQGFYYSRPIPPEEFEKLLSIGYIHI